MATKSETPGGFKDAEFLGSLLSVDRKSGVSDSPKHSTLLFTNQKVHPLLAWTSIW